MSGVDDGRGLDPETLERYFDAEAPTRHVLRAVPECALAVDPRQRTLKLSTPATASPAEVGQYDRLDFDVVRDPGDGSMRFELSVRADGLECEAYSFLVTVSERLAAGEALGVAVSRSIDTFGAVLAKSRGLSERQQLGLFGELGMFGALVATVEERAAVDAWLGPEGEEHDFAFRGCDLEVESTLGERRVHLIGSPEQPTRSQGRPLYLVSMQYTLGGGAETLPEPVARTRRRLREGLALFDRRMEALGWSGADAERLYPRSYRPRSGSRVYAVDGQFPAVTREALEGAVPRPGLSYRVDVTPLEPCRALPAEISGAMGAWEKEEI